MVLFLRMWEEWGSLVRGSSVMIMHVIFLTIRQLNEQIISRYVLSVYGGSCKLWLWSPINDVKVLKFCLLLNGNILSLLSVDVYVCVCLGRVSALRLITVVSVWRVKLQYYAIQYNIRLGFLLVPGTL